MVWVNVCDDKPSRRNSKAWNDYALPGIPTTLLIDGETGAIIARDCDLEEVLSTLLP